MTAWRVAAAAAGGIVLLVGAALLLASRAWQRATAVLVGRLRDEALSAEPRSPPTPGELAALPPPVARYLAYALGQEAPVRIAQVLHAGEFRSRLGSEAAHFTSVQTIAARPRGFIWDAAISLLPLVPVRVRDTYLAGRGSMDGRIGGLFPVVAQSGSPELASGALARWLGEAVWLPSALLPGDGLSWEAVDEASARVTLEDGGARVSMLVQFGSSGAIVRITAERYREAGGLAVLTPWIVELGDYTHTGGMMIPMTGSVSWQLPEGRLEYWKARIVDVSYER
jgi:hypothetical protein